MITENIKSQIQEAMKARDELRVSTLKMLSSALHNEKISKQKDLDEEQEIAVIRKEAKKREDAILAFKNAGRDEQAKKEQDELEILKEFLPKEMSDEDLEKLVEESVKSTGASEIKDMGLVIGEVLKASEGKASGGRVSELVKAKLSS